MRTGSSGQLFSTVTVTLPKTATPVISPNGANFIGQGTVTISANSGATIRYSLNNTAVLTGPVYTGPISVTSNTVIRAVAFQTNKSNSDLATATFNVAALPPIFNTANGTNFSGSGSVSMSPGTAGSTIRYTTDSSPVNSSSTVYSGAIPITANTTIRAAAYMAQMTDSSAVNASYTVTAPQPSISPSSGTSCSIQPEGTILHIYDMTLNPA